MDYGHWLFNVEFTTDEWFGFIYKITELDTGREYIGKKQFFNTTRKIVKGKKNRKKVISESNWKVYTGSSEHLNSQISIKGKENYKFEILSLHDSKGSLHYAEVEYQITHNVLRELLDDGITKKYFNRAVAGVKFIPPVESVDETRIAISKILTGDNYTIAKMTVADYEKWLDENLRGEHNPMFGKIPHNKNKTFEELYGVEKAARLKKMLSNYAKQQFLNGKMNHGKHSDETKEKLRQANIGKHKGKNNNMYGKPCYHKMDEKQIEAWKENISKATKGKKLSDTHKAAMKKNWDNNPIRKKECAIRRSEMNKMLSDEHKNATRNSNIKRGYETTRKKVENDLERYINITRLLNNGRLVKDIAIETDSTYRLVWIISKKIEYYVSIINDIKGTQ
jgi:hypothetical protein